jgi:hypothetical protein
MNEHKANGPEPNDAANDPPVTPKKQKIDPLEIRAKALEYDGLVARCPIQYGGDFTLMTPSTSSSSRPRQGASPGAGTNLGPIMHCADHPGILLVIAHFASKVPST